MKIPQVAIVLLGFAIIAGVLPQSNGQAPEQPILPAPTTQERATQRSDREASEPHPYTNRIVGGVPSNGRPFMAALLYEKDGKLFQYCGASVIGDQWLLTAAHCEVKAGELAIINRSNLGSPGGIELRIEHVYPNEQYDSTTHDNDIALLHLSGKISSVIPHVNVIAPPRTGTKVLAAGWGLTTENGKPSLLLREVQVPIISSTICKTKYADLSGNMVCAGEAGKDSCQGDSGGPLLLVGSGAEQVGIVSYGLGCGRKGWPGVYTEVYNYQKWINDTMRQ